MAMKNDRYTYRIIWSEADKEHVGLCVEFPSLSWLAKSPESALMGIRAVVEDVVNDMMENGEFPPQPLSTRRYSGNFIVRIPPEIHRQLTIEAAEAGISLNRHVSSKLGR
jgi:predicted HicB family RNase H-like nuclease